MASIVAAVSRAAASARSRSAGGRSAGRSMPKLDEAIVRAAREAAGPTAKLFVDAGAQRRVLAARAKWAMRTAEMLEDYDVGWFEEPLPPDAHRRLSAAAPRPPGADRRRRGADAAAGFLPWLTRGAFDIVQPDVTKVGGISEQRRIAWMAYEFGVRYIAMAGTRRSASPPICSSASAFPDADLVEFIGGCPYVDGITEKPFALDGEGYLEIPDLPGLGVALDREKLARYTPDPAPLFG